MPRFTPGSRTSPRRAQSPCDDAAQRGAAERLLAYMAPPTFDGFSVSRLESTHDNTGHQGRGGIAASAGRERLPSGGGLFCCSWEISTIAHGALPPSESKILLMEPWRRAAAGAARKECQVMEDVVQYA